MARLPKEFIDTVKDKADIFHYIDQRLKLKRAGKDYHALCPFHEEKSPSFTVNAEKQFYYCFGCGASGNIFSFAQEYDGLSFPEAVANIAIEAGLELPGQAVSTSKSEKTPEERDMLKALYFANQKFMGCINYPEVKEYLQHRKLPPAIVAQYQLGFAPKGFGFIAKNTPERWIEPNIQASIIKESQTPGSHMDSFYHRLMFPIRNLSGHVIGFAGRALDAKVKPKYLNSQESSLFQKRNIVYGLYEALEHTRRPESIVVVEGYIDVLSLTTIEINNSVAVMGRALTDSHCELLFKHTNHIVFIFDGDQAGLRAAIESCSTVLPHLYDGRRASWVFLPSQEDPDSLAKILGTEGFTEFINDGKQFDAMIIEQGLRLAGDDSPKTDPITFIQSISTFYELMPEGMLKYFFLNKVASLTNIAPTLIIELFRCAMSSPHAKRGS